MILCDLRGQTRLLRRFGVSPDAGMVRRGRYRRVCDLDRRGFRESLYLFERSAHLS